MSAGIKANNDGSAAIQVGGVDRVSLTDTGNVGIGTSSPLGTLDVNSASTGSIYARGGSVQSYLFGSSAGGLGAVGTASNHPFSLYTNNTEQARLTSAGLFQFNSGYGSVATAYGCRAWVNFNGTGTVAIRGSGNVTSITDVGVGSYRVNFTNSMPDANYAAHISGGSFVSSSNTLLQTTGNNASQCFLYTYVSGAQADLAEVYASVFR